MEHMFNNSIFNGDISKWNIGKVLDMHDMFAQSKFNKDISNWDISHVIIKDDIFNNCPIKDEYKPNF